MGWQCESSFRERERCLPVVLLPISLGSPPSTGCWLTAQSSEEVRERLRKGHTQVELNMKDIQVIAFSPSWLISKKKRPLCAEHPWCPYTTKTCHFACWMGSRVLFSILIQTTICFLTLLQNYEKQIPLTLKSVTKSGWKTVKVDGLKRCSHLKK